MDLISREAVKENHQKWLGYLDEDMIARLNIAVDKHIPSAFDGMTNGDVVKAVFPNMKVHEYTEKVVLNGLGDEFQIQSMAWKNWWNAPYKGVSE